MVSVGPVDLLNQAFDPGLLNLGTIYICIVSPKFSVICQSVGLI